MENNYDSSSYLVILNLGYLSGMESGEEINCNRLSGALSEEPQDQDHEESQ